MSKPVSSESYCCCWPKSHEEKPLVAKRPIKPDPLAEVQEDIRQIMLRRRATTDSTDSTDSTDVRVLQQQLIQQQMDKISAQAKALKSSDSKS